MFSKKASLDRVDEMMRLRRASDPVPVLKTVMVSGDLYWILATAM